MYSSRTHQSIIRVVSWSYLLFMLLILVKFHLLHQDITQQSHTCTWFLDLRHHNTIICVACSIRRNLVEVKLLWNCFINIKFLCLCVSIAYLRLLTCLDRKALRSISAMLGLPVRWPNPKWLLMFHWLVGVIRFLVLLYIYLCFSSLIA